MDKLLKLFLALLLAPANTLFADEEVDTRKPEQDVKIEENEVEVEEESTIEDDNDESVDENDEQSSFEGLSATDIAYF